MSDRCQKMFDWARQNGFTWLCDESPEELAQRSRLYLCSQEIRELPEAIGCMKSLTRIDLRGNSIERLPEALGELTQLESLDITAGRLAGLPEAIGRLQHLQYLRINSCKLPFLPESLGGLCKLTQLHLSDNRLTCLPETMAQLERLKHLALDGNQLAELPEWLSELPSLVWLDLRNNPLTRLPAGLGRMKNLRDLAFDKSRVIDPPQLAWITEMLQRPLGKLQAAFGEKLSHWGHQLPTEDVVHRRRGQLGGEDGGDYCRGDTVQYLFGSDEQGEYLDFYLRHRIAGDWHGRIYEDGRTINLPTLPIGRPCCSVDPVEDARLEAASRFEYNEIAAMLRAKGFED